MHRNATLLAHAGAPSSGKDDQRYKAQLRSYLDLGTAKISRLPYAAHATATDVSYGANSQGTEHADDRHEDISPEGPAYLDDTQLAYTALESQLFISNASASRSTTGASRISKPLLYGTPIAPKNVVADTSYHAVSIPSPAQLPSEDTSPSQSSYLVSPFAVRRAKRTRTDCEHQSKSSLDSPAAPNQSSEHREKRFSNVTNQRDLDRNRHGQSAEGTTTTNETTSELPTSYSLSDAGPESLQEKPYLESRSNTDPGPVTRGSAGMFDPVRKPRSIHGTDQAPVTLGPGLREDEVVVLGEKDSVQAVPASVSAEVIALQALPMEIQPPEPSAAFAGFVTHVTTSLQRLTQNPDVSKAYNPISVSRALQPLERGYWSVECSAWPLQKQLEFWNFLDTFIRNGKVGWGVWCTRSTEYDYARQLTESDKNHDGPDMANEKRNFVDIHRLGHIKVYCWGEIVEHIYLLLYIASGSKVRRIGLQWIDAAGQVVVQMRQSNT